MHDYEILGDGKLTLEILDELQARFDALTWKEEQK